ncbi:hypothetical protein NQ318_004304 [Aromia moschata]|uniref:Uncharacterized protein n=1 Tax=Aromia moschata TaxID=1265417 RepID=A0AAV8YQR7_9CUCU|nr:hypothetical protein NQ318_004304 [Aromia moschata]
MNILENIKSFSKFLDSNSVSIKLTNCWASNITTFTWASQRVKPPRYMVTGRFDDPSSVICFSEGKCIDLSDTGIYP